MSVWGTGKMTQQTGHEEQERVPDAAQLGPISIDEGRIMSMVGSIPWGVHLFELTADGRLVLIFGNPAADTMLGVKHRDLIGRTVEEAFPELAGEIANRYSEIASTGNPWRSGEVVYKTEKIRRIFEILAFKISQRRVVDIINDITDRKQAEDFLARALNETKIERERLSALVNSITDEIWFADPDGKFVLANPSAKIEFSIDSNSEPGIEQLANSLEVVRPDGTPRPLEEAPPLRALKGEIVRNQLEIVRTPVKGELRYRQVSSSPVRNGNGDIIGSVSVVRDVTEQKEAEVALERNVEILKRSKKELESAKSRLEAIVQSIPAGVFTCDTQGRTKMFNQALVEIWGGKAPLPQSFSEFREFKAWWADSGEAVAPSDWPISVAMREGRSIEGRTFDIERFDGTRGTIISSALPLCDSNGNVVEGMAFAQDITEQRLAELVQRDQKDRLQFILDSLPVGVLMADEHGQVLHRNKKVDEILGEELPLPGTDGYSQFIGSLPGEDRRLSADEWPMARSIKKGEKVDNVEIETRLTDGRRATLIVSSVPIRDGGGKVAGGLTAFMDITRQKQIEKDLAQSNTELQNFAYAASHDLKEPLRTISGFLELLEMDYGAVLDDKAKDYVHRAVDASSRLHDMINDILSYSRLETRKKPFARIDLNDVSRQVVHELNKRIKEAGAVVKIDPLPTIWGDDTQLGIVFRNLIDNAIKFHGKEDPTVEITATKLDGEWAISVKDNGIGMNPSDYGRIFNMFVRIHPRKEYPGTGIGLAMCRKIVERHGGRIWAESKVGLGSTITFTLWLPDYLDIGQSATTNP